MTQRRTLGLGDADAEERRLGERDDERRTRVEGRALLRRLGETDRGAALRRGAVRLRIAGR